MARLTDTILLDGAVEVPSARFGSYASRLARVAGCGVPVPVSVAMSIDAVRGISEGHNLDVSGMLEAFGENPLLSVRSSPLRSEWGGSQQMLHVGMNESVRKKIAECLDSDTATEQFLRFVYAYSIRVAKLDADAIDDPEKVDRQNAGENLQQLLQLYREETGEEFPETVSVQLAGVLRSMSDSWESTSARMLRMAHGAPDDAGLGLVVQQMGVGCRTCGHGRASAIDFATGEPGLHGSYSSLRPVPRSGKAGCNALDGMPPEALHHVSQHLVLLQHCNRDPFEIDFTVEGDKALVVDARPAPRSAQAEVAVAVALAEAEIIEKPEALMRLEPDNIARLLHKQVDRSRPRTVIARGIAASPGAASGAIVFSSAAASKYAARDESCILVRVETGPEDIRGMHTARGVLTGRGGITSHAAVIARGLGVPCVAGSSDIQFDPCLLVLKDKDGRVFREGQIITIDGTAGEVLEGAAALVKPAVNEAFERILAWSDEYRDIGVRANADTLEEVRAACGFKAEGIGLCRTEHMFFEESRLTVMREMIFAADIERRRETLEKLLPMQRGDFLALFEIMSGNPVCIRLFDPPLHEFLPHDPDEITELADAMGLSARLVESRVEELKEFNPMLGMRGVRLGITVPEIYEMQARAIFEAAAQAIRAGWSAKPEIMIPLVSANKEVILVESCIEAVADQVRAEQGVDFRYKTGVMVETPRAALKADDLASNSAFLSFGTNDLTQLTYGISRDDSERFMDIYVKRNVFPDDPFETFDQDGVGELLLLAAERGRRANRDVTLAICGEHAADPATIQFCRDAGFTYVSCSPFRVPVARLAAAQSAIRATDVKQKCHDSK